MSLVHVVWAIWAVTCAAQLLLGVLALLRLRESRLALPTALFAFVTFVWTFAGWAHGLTEQQVWVYVDRTFSPLTSATSLHFVLVFVGDRRRRRWLLWLSYAAHGALVLCSAAAFVSAWGSRFVVSSAWELWHIVLILAVVGFILGRLVTHIAQQPDRVERARAQLLFVSTAAGGILGPAVVLDPTIPLPVVSINILIVTMLVFRLRLLGSELRALHAVLIAVGTLVTVLLCLLALRFFKASVSVALIMASSTMALLVALALSVVRRRLNAQRQLHRLAFAGRLAGQITHDLKNPLAALKGAAQFLKTERARGRSIDDQSQFLDILVEESERLSRLLDKYANLARLSPSPQPVSVNALVEQVVSLGAFRTVPHEGVDLELALAPEMPQSRLDPVLLATAVENLLANAWEAVGDGASIVVRTRCDGPAREPRAVLLEIEDSGEGIDPREIEAVQEEFVTYKPRGSGLGLPFVRQVVAAHRGEFSIDSALGRGTTCRIRLPLQ